MEAQSKYSPVEGAADTKNLIVGIFCIANELAELNRHIGDGLVTYAHE
jgi:hypothetical protein